MNKLQKPYTKTYTNYRIHMANTQTKTAAKHKKATTNIIQ